ncbi:hypothetical protein NQD34_010065 [Periophthalmus magnuspinnatus]|nr:hypothetical protein NQD34_010065 [Periophthalmus magnuspinnatus]
MSQNRLPSSSEVIGWTPEKLAEFLRKRNLQGCDRVVLLNRITGERFVNLTNNDLDKFPKTYNPLISKLISDIHKQKSGKRRFFPFGQSKNPQPVETETDDVGWGREEFDDSDDGDEFDDDYEEPENEEDDVGDYEDPSEDLEPTQVQTRYQSQTQDQEQDSDYEPPPSEPDDFSHKLPCAPVGDGDYIDSHMSSRGPPPALCPGPPVSTPHRTVSTRCPPILLCPVSDALPSSCVLCQMPSLCSLKHFVFSHRRRRDVSPRPPTGPKHAGKLPPPVCRVNKPGRDAGSSSSPIRGASRNTVEKVRSLLFLCRWAGHFVVICGGQGGFELCPVS